MNTADLIISIVFVCINSTALFLIYRSISRWMTRNEKKIDNLEHAVLKIDDYIKYSSHTIDAVCIDAQNRLIEQFVKDDDYERASIVKKNRQLVEAAVLEEMKRRMKEMEAELFKGSINKEHNQKKGDTKEG
jgi:biopolymer transport protein ExbB/TolQ